MYLVINHHFPHLGFSWGRSPALSNILCVGLGVRGVEVDSVSCSDSEVIVPFLTLFPWLLMALSDRFSWD